MNPNPYPSEIRNLHELVPLVPLDEWWQWLAAAAVWIVLVAATVWLYRRDARSLSGPIAVTLMTLRIGVILGLLVFFLGPQRRSETRIVKPSEIHVLVDTSLSMGLADDPDDATRQRMTLVTELFEEQPLLRELNTRHRLRLFRFDESARAAEVVAVERQPRGEAENFVPDNVSPGDGVLAANWLARGIVGCGLLALVVAAGNWMFGGPQFRTDGCVCIAALAVVSGVAVAGVASLVGTIDAPVDPVPDIGGEGDSKLANGPRAYSLQQAGGIDWLEYLTPRGTATRLGDALLDLVQNRRTRGTAAILLVTDGGQNQGVSVDRGVTAATDASVPLYVIGVGSRRPLQNARVSQIEAPQKVYPGDPFQVRAILQSFGMNGQSARVQLLASEVGAEHDSPEAELVDETTVPLGEDGAPMTVEFTVSPGSEGSHQYSIRIEPPPGDFDSGDNLRRATVQVVTGRTRVLLIAGGPTRDYQFLRNQLFRDADIQLDVWLQMAVAGADQESDSMLYGFPESDSELNEYDCIVAFDPDWRLLSPPQTASLESWVSRQAGGLIVVAGPVFTPEWTRRPRGDESIDRIRRLYPVSFYSQGSATLKLGRFGGIRPFPLEFSREGMAAEFLRLAATPEESTLAWQAFNGVFGYYAVNEPRAGTDVLAWFSDPETATDGRQPIWLASHFYGSGRVVFQASGEIWRLRDVNVNFFQTYYLNLIRWASQGRLLRDSTQGVLLLDRNRCWVGDQVAVRALLNDAAGNPLVATQVQATVMQPDGIARPLVLQNNRDASRPGTFSGQFLASCEGLYEIRLPIPGATEWGDLRGEVQATIPDLEKLNPQRNDELLSTMAARTGGVLLTDLARDGTAIRFGGSIAGTDRTDKDEVRVRVSDPRVLADLIHPVDQQSWLPGTPSPAFAHRLAVWLTGWLVLTLSIEWTIRRLYRLA